VNGEFVGFIPVTDLDQARAFYVNTLGLEEKETSPFALVVGSGACTIRLTAVDGLRAQPFTIAGWLVEKIDAEVDRLAAAGVEFKRFDGMDQDGRGVWQSPGGSRVAWFSDPDGNVLSVTEA
jgi:catechol 2,3-dioxygenase-like lactoylglutathione lyase family enzyme